MAIHLQDPFENKPTDTPMTTIARSIENNLQQLYGLEKGYHKKAGREQMEEPEEFGQQSLSQNTYYVL